MHLTGIARLVHVSVVLGIGYSTLREKFMSSNGHGNIALTGRAHCQRQVAFLLIWAILDDNNMPTLIRSMTLPIYAASLSNL